MATLNIPIQHITQKELFNVRITEFENGAEQRALTSSTPRRTFSCTTRTLRANEKAYLVGFYTARKGAFESFTWVNPLDNGTYRVRFVKDSLSISDVNSYLYVASFELIEVI